MQQISETFRIKMTMILQYCVLLMLFCIDRAFGQPKDEMKNENIIQKIGDQQRFSSFQYPSSSVRANTGALPPLNPVGSTQMGHSMDVSLHSRQNAKERENKRRMDEIREKRRLPEILHVSPQKLHSKEESLNPVRLPKLEKKKVDLEPIVVEEITDQNTGKSSSMAPKEDIYSNERLKSLIHAFERDPQKVTKLLNAETEKRKQAKALSELKLPPIRPDRATIKFSEQENQEIENAVQQADGIRRKIQGMRSARGLSTKLLGENAPKAPPYVVPLQTRKLKSASHEAAGRKRRLYPLQKFQLLLDTIHSVEPDPSPKSTI